MKEKIINLLQKIPYEAWDNFVKNEPEYKNTTQVLDKYGPNRFLTFMAVTGLNDYQLKGPAEEKYWPLLRKHILKNPIPSSPKGLAQILEEFYEKERFKSAKIKRLYCFLESDIATKIWYKEPLFVARNFKEIWNEIAKVMGQKKTKKTIVFSMKCLGIGLIMLGIKEFDFSGIPVPVDSRIIKLFRIWGLIKNNPGEKEIQRICDELLDGIKSKNSAINMIHLDSFLWQIKSFYSNNNLYLLKEMGIPNSVIQELINLVS